MRPAPAPVPKRGVGKPFSGQEPKGVMQKIMVFREIPVMIKITRKYLIRPLPQVGRYPAAENLHAPPDRVQGKVPEVPLIALSAGFFADALFNEIKGLGKQGPRRFILSEGKKREMEAVETSERTPLRAPPAVDTDHTPFEERTFPFSYPQRIHAAHMFGNFARLVRPFKTPPLHTSEDMGVHQCAARTNACPLSLQGRSPAVIAQPVQIVAMGLQTE